MGVTFGTADFALLSLLTLVANHLAESSRGADTTKCFSCMSEVYKLHWSHLSYTYQRPQNFTEKCDRNQDKKDLSLIDCPSVCILMIEKMVVGGYEAHGYIRGCFDTMLVHGFNESAVYAYRWLKRDLCRWYDRKQVLKLPVKTEGEIYLCACYGDGCNGSPKLSGATTHSRLPLVFTVPLVVTLWTHLVLNHQRIL